jgi:Holliday junction resolvase
MSGRAPRQKGDRTERAVVQALRSAGIPAKRVPLSGSANGYPGDIQALLGGREMTLEVKSRKDYKTLYDWLEDRDGLVLKADRKEALIVMRLDDLLDIMGLNNKSPYRKGGDGAKPEPDTRKTSP